MYKKQINPQCSEDQTNDKWCVWHPEADQVKGLNMGITTSVKYLKVIVTDDGSKPDILSRISRALAALTKP